MTEVTFSVPQNDSMIMEQSLNLAFLMGYPKDQSDTFSLMIINFVLECTIREIQENSRDWN
jgi:hypothetical protein